MVDWTKIMETYRNYIFYRINMLRAFGYHISGDDEKDFIQDAALALFKEFPDGEIESEEKAIKIIISSTFRTMHGLFRNPLGRAYNIDKLCFLMELKDPYQIDNALVAEEDETSIEMALREKLTAEEIVALKYLGGVEKLAELGIGQVDSETKQKIFYLRKPPSFEFRSDIERETVRIYRDVLLGVTSRLPRHFWEQNDLDVRIGAMVKYLFDDIVDKHPKDVRYVGDVLRTHKLGHLNKGSVPYNILEIIRLGYPDIEDWEIRHQRMWNEETGRKLIRDI